MQRQLFYYPQPYGVPAARVQAQHYPLAQPLIIQKPPQQQQQQQQKWFMETGELWPGEAFSLEIEKELFREKSKYQDVRVFQSKCHGKVLVLDGVIQVTERDEFAYQEMITHVAMACHRNPERVLVIGGGDGGVLREVCKHKEAREIVECEIDELVVNVSKKYFPALAQGYSDARVTLHIGDGFEFLRQKENYYDVIITDSSDPVGPAQSLFESEYYRLLYNSIRKGGIVVSQCESVFLHLDMIANIVKSCRGIYQSVGYYVAQVPT